VPMKIPSMLQNCLLKLQRFLHDRIHRYALLSARSDRV
jgi:hypothetical protein